MKKELFCRDAENHILGAILAYPSKCLDTIRASGLKKEEFYVPQNKSLFGVLIGMANRHQDIDLATVSIEVQRLEIEKIITVDFITWLLGIVHPVDAGEKRIGEYIKTVRNYAVRRAIEDVARNLLSEVHNEDKDIALISSDVQESLINITAKNKQENWHDMEENLLQYLDVIMQRQSGKSTSLNTGFDDIDKSLGGFEKGQLIILAARPSMGKTTLALNIAKNELQNEKEKRSVLFVSQEMTKILILDRYVSSSIGINNFRLKNTVLSEREKNKVIRFCESIKGYNFDIFEGRRTISEIKARAELDLAKFSRLDLIIIDHIQLIKSESRGRYSSRVHEVGEIAHSLKELAVRLNVPVLALSQLSRASETRENKRPELSDLRESGDLEQDADVVLGLYRDSYYKHSLPECGYDIAELGILKARDAECKNIHLRFYPQFQLFRPELK